jgi:hypothetical protein
MIKSYDFLMQSTFDRILEGKLFDNNLKPYSQDFLKKVLKYLESKERFEDCFILEKIISNRSNHDKNYKTINI